MEKKYDSKEVEPRIQKLWIDSGIYKFDPKSNKPVFSIDTPPPTVSGKLHIGHAMHYTQFEFIARFKRMQGFNVLFPIGFDDNGQPTERYIEKKHNIDLTKISKSEFINLVKKDIIEVENGYKRDLMRLGHSHDWDLTYRTIQDNCAKTAQTSFIDLLKKDYVYRSEEPTIWCTSCKTALSQADVEDQERNTKIYDIDFVSEGKKITIATTRPELLPACVGIFVHPDDKRYTKLVGKKATVPIFGQEVSIMKDSKVDSKFGTGIVMICTFGDKTDIEWWKIHKLPLKIIVSADGKLQNSGKYTGLKLKEARKEILKVLDDLKVLGKDEQLKQNVGTCWRCHEPIEFLVTKQWFVKIIENKEKLIQQGRKINWHPNYYVKRYEDWVNNLSWDWLISRQRHHGISIPVWYCECGELLLPDVKDLPIDPEVDKPKQKCKCGSSKFIPEKDVFDTWMTSSMSPEIVLKWTEKNNMMKYSPEDMRPQAHDIIRTWAFYTVVKSLYHFNEIPWKNVMVSGHALDSKGKSMHKSLGNVIDPMEVLDNYNADSLRFWAASAKLGEDISFQEKELVAAQKTITKLWNASKFVIMSLENYNYQEPKNIESIDKWLLNRLSETVEQVTKEFEDYQYSSAKFLTEQLFWKDFCDNYLEIAKHRLYNEDETTESARYTLYKTLLGILKMFAPIMPHVTEEIYQNYFKDKEKVESIHISSWPEKENIKENNGHVAVEAIVELRKYKHSNKMALNAELNKVIISSVEDISEFENDIKGAMKIKEIEFKKGEELKIEVV
ncbi:MAG: valine--tRNA ligase [Nanoarchaeota archaeon]|nr:valine--tRNA ligase [Nanoarchaeota archaeon]